MPLTWDREILLTFVHIDLELSLQEILASCPASREGVTWRCCPDSSASEKFAPVAEETSAADDSDSDETLNSILRHRCDSDSSFNAAGLPLLRNIMGPWSLRCTADELSDSSEEETPRRTVGKLCSMSEEEDSVALEEEL